MESKIAQLESIFEMFCDDDNVVDEVMGECMSLVQNEDVEMADRIRALAILDEIESGEKPAKPLTEVDVILYLKQLEEYF